MHRLILPTHSPPSFPYLIPSPPLPHPIFTCVDPKLARNHPSAEEPNTQRIGHCPLPPLLPPPRNASTFSGSFLPTPLSARILWSTLYHSTYDKMLLSSPVLMPRLVSVDKTNRLLDLILYDYENDCLGELFLQLESGNMKSWENYHIHVGY